MHSVAFLLLRDMLWSFSRWPIKVIRNLEKYIMNALMLQIIEDIVSSIENKPHKTMEDILLVARLSNLAIQIMEGKINEK